MADSRHISNNRNTTMTTSRTSTDHQMKQQQQQLSVNITTNNSTTASTTIPAKEHSNRSNSKDDVVPLLKHQHQHPQQHKKNQQQHQQHQQLTYLEFYSGVGGWTMAIDEACRQVNINLTRREREPPRDPSSTSQSSPVLEDGKLSQRRQHRRTRMRLSAKRLASFDHSDLCNRVLHYNFPDEDEDHTDDVDCNEEGRDGENSKQDTITSIPPESPVAVSTNNRGCRNSTSTSTSKRRRKKEENRKGSTSCRNKRNAAAISTVAIERLTRVQLQNLNAFIWSMSPPCQPYTRQHNRQQDDLTDQRAKSFLHLCDMLRVMDGNTLPKIIVLENVIGFESSQSCQKWRNVLKARNYRINHLHLTPTQVEIPNDRPRYYCIAILRLRSCPTTTTRPPNLPTKDVLPVVANIDADAKDWNHSSSNPYRYDDDHEDQTLESWFASKEDIIGDDDNDDTQQPHRLTISRNIQTNITPLAVMEMHQQDEEQNDATNNKNKNTNNTSSRCKPIAHFLDPIPNPTNPITHLRRQGDDNDGDGSLSLFVSPKILTSNASWCFDIVTPSDRRSACFTHSYGRFVRGTGSVLFLGSSNNGNGRGNSGIRDECDDDSNCTKRLKTTVSSTSSILMSATPTTTSEPPPSSSPPPPPPVVTDTSRFKLVPAHERTFDSNWADGVDLQNNLRYFSGEEIARLMGFPVATTTTPTTATVATTTTISHDGAPILMTIDPNDDDMKDTIMNANDNVNINANLRTFSFPPDMTVRQKWKLLGNSLNVTVAAKIVEVSLRLWLLESSLSSIDIDEGEEN